MLLIGTVSLLSAQEQATITPQPKWRLGDKRQVDMVGSMTIQTGGLAAMMDFTSTYQLEVTRAKKDGYELAVRTERLEESNGQLQEGARGLDDEQRIEQQLVRAAFDPFSTAWFRYEVDVDGRMTGRMEEKNGKEKVTTAMRQGVEEAIGKIKEVTDGSFRLPDAAVWFLVDSLYDAYLEDQEKCLAQVLKIYSTEFPGSGSVRQGVPQDRMRSPIFLQMPPMGGSLEAGLDRNDGKELIGRTIFSFDQEALMVNLERAGLGMPTLEGLSLTEECVEQFDKRSTWLTQASTTSRLKSEVMTVYGTMEMNLKVIK